MLSTDYLIIGGGAVGLAFADQLLTDTDATITIVDRRAAVGGHWNDAYPFVRLHQPSVYYGVGSRPLGDHQIDVEGLNRGYYRMATGDEVLSYFHTLMADRLLPSGRVAYFPRCEFTPDRRIVSLETGEAQPIAIGRKIVDTTFFDVKTPADHTPSFTVSPGVTLITPRDLPTTPAPQGRYVIVGAGKTAMDAIVWLLETGADPAKVRWVVPRDSWLINRDRVQPGEAFFDRTVGGQALQLEAAAQATSLDDLYRRLEQAGLLLRIDPAVSPTMYRAATIAPAEVELLRRVTDVVRKGRVLRLETDAIQLEAGAEPASPDDLYVDCSARGLRTRPTVPIFDGDRITVQMVRANIICFSTALIAHVEATYGDDAEKNDLCVPIPVTERHTEWPRGTAADLRNARRWSQDKPLRRWISEHRLSGNIGPAGPRSDAAQAIGARIAAARGPAEENLNRLAAELG